MKSFIAAFMAVLLLAASPARAAAIIGETAPDFSADGASGKTVKLSDYKGKIVVLEWTSSECPFVHKWYDSGTMQKLQKKAAGEGIVWLSVNSSAPGKPGHWDTAAANDWIKTTGAAAADILLDGKGEVGRLYGAQTTPHMFVIDKDCKLVYAGAIDSIASPNREDIPKATNYVEQAIAELTAGKAVSMNSTKSYGCSVKY